MSFQNARHDEEFVNLSFTFRQPLAEEASAESFDAPLSSSLFPAGRCNYIKPMPLLSPPLRLL
jgi:hypothetical protein